MAHLPGCVQPELQFEITTKLTQSALNAEKFSTVSKHQAMNLNDGCALLRLLKCSVELHRMLQALFGQLYALRELQTICLVVDPSPMYLCEMIPPLGEIMARSLGARFRSISVFFKGLASRGGRLTDDVIEQFVGVSKLLFDGSSCAISSWKKNRLTDFSVLTLTQS
jgi:hypothetical protein